MAKKIHIDKLTTLVSQFSVSLSRILRDSSPGDWEKNAANCREQFIKDLTAECPEIIKLIDWTDPR